MTDHDERPADPAGLVLAQLAELRGVPDDLWIEGSHADLAHTLHRLTALVTLAQDRAAEIGQQLADSMETEIEEVPGLGRLRRVEQHPSAWKFKHSGQQLRDDLAVAVATNVALDVATGDIDPMKRNVALATMRTAYEAIPSFSSLNKAGRERLNLQLSDYREFSTHYKVVVEAVEDDEA